LVATSSEISTTQINSNTSQVTIGKLNVSDSRHFAGQIPEIIFYNTAVNQTQRKIIDNYLSSKFDISIANNIYTLDQPANGNFDFNVIGIGRESSSDLHRNSKGSGIIRVNSPSNLNNGEYLFIGSDILNDSSLDFTSIDCLSATPDDILTEATWRIGKYNGDVGDVDISFDTSSIGLDPTVAELLVSSSPNFVNPTIISSSSVSGNDVVFSGVNFANGDYIKLRFKTIEPILWDGTSFSNGSGIANAPDTSDFGRKLIIDGANAELNEDANCFCATITNNSDLSLNNNILDIKKQFVNNGVFDGSEGTLEFSGDLNKFISGKSFEVANFITHANTSINLDTTLDINNLLDVRGGILTTGGDINLICNFGTLGKTAQVGPVGGVIVGDVTVEQCFPARRAFRLISPSVTTSTSIRENWQENPVGYQDNPRPGYGTHITGVSPGSADANLGQDGDDGFDYSPSGNASMFTFNNATPSWDRLTNTNGGLTAGEAYRLFLRGDRSINITLNAAPPTNTRLSATGVLATGTQTEINLSNTADAFNLIGNPYQAQVDMNALIAGSTNISSADYYVWDPTLGGTPTPCSLGGRGAYVLVDLGTGSNSSSSSANQFLQPVQAFFVRTDTDDTASVTFQEAMKAVNQTQTVVKSNSIQEYINIQLFNANSFAEGETPSDGLRINFDKSFSILTEDDSPKLGNLDENLARVEGNVFSAIERRPLPEATQELPLFINQYRRESYVMKFDVTDNLNIEVFIKDSYLETLTEITSSENTYSFAIESSIPESVASDRFSLVFEPVSLSTGNEDLVNLSLYPNPTKGNFSISGIDSGQDTEVKIYNLIGQQVYTAKSSGQSTLEITDFNGTTGVYLVKLNTNQGEKTFKLIKD
jgi:hypothetical protein